MQAVVVNRLHQRKQSPQTARRKSLAGEPVEVMARQIGNQTAFVFAKGHLYFDQLDQELRIYRVH